jgi:Uma2 family endonuclease
MSSRDTHRDRALPPVDARLAVPDTRYEILDGVVTYVSPADAPHGTRHPKLAALLEAHVGPAFDVAVDMLTRTSRRSDFAPDASVFPVARDPRTGGRQLEHLAFELVSTQTLRRAGAKAAELVARGVRRVFAIDVVRDRALEWSARQGDWQPVDPRTRIEDVVFAVPLPIGALLRSAKADDAVARALIQKRNPVIKAVVAAGRRKGRAEGKRAGLAAGKRAGLAAGKRAGLAAGKRAGLAAGVIVARRAAVLEVLIARGMVLAARQRARIREESDPARLARWLVGAATCDSVAAMFATP